MAQRLISRYAKQSGQWSEAHTCNLSIDSITFCIIEIRRLQQQQQHDDVYDERTDQV